MNTAEMIAHIRHLEAVAVEYHELRKELDEAAKHLRSRSASYRHKAADDSFEDGKARAYGVGASDIAFAVERSQRRLERTLGSI
jgi:hypothetical protein